MVVAYCIAACFDLWFLGVDLSTFGYCFAMYDTPVRGERA
jgi:hypothetical protein